MLSFRLALICCMALEYDSSAPVMAASAWNMELLNFTTSAEERQLLFCSIDLPSTATDSSP